MPASLASVGASPNDGLGAVLKAVEGLPADERAEVEAAVTKGFEDGPAIAMVDSEQGHHQPPRAERRHRRRVDAGDDPHVRPHVEPRRRRAGHARRAARQLVRRHLPGRPRRLPRPRRLRPGDDGLGLQRRPHGAGGRGVRQPRQDVRDPGRRRPCASSTAPARRCSSTRSRPATSGAPARPRTCRSATGSSSPSRAPAPRATPAIFWLDADRAHDANLIAKVNEYLTEHDTDGLTIEIMKPTDAIAYSLGPHPQGRGHDLGHRQRAA